MKKKALNGVFFRLGMAFRENVVLSEFLYILQEIGQNAFLYKITLLSIILNLNETDFSRYNDFFVLQSFLIYYSIVRQMHYVFC